jgi:hypothetical protein
MIAAGAPEGDGGTQLLAGELINRCNNDSNNDNTNTNNYDTVIVVIVIVYSYDEEF